MTVRGKERLHGVIRVDFLGMNFDVDVRGKTWAGVVAEVLVRSGYPHKGIADYEVSFSDGAIIDKRTKASADKSPVFMKPLPN